MTTMTHDEPNQHAFDGSYFEVDCHTCGMSYLEGQHLPVDDPRNIFDTEDQKTL